MPLCFFLCFYRMCVYYRVLFKTRGASHYAAPARRKRIRVHSSAVERRIADPEVAGSIPAAPCGSRLAQLVERKTLNLVVVGSSPTVGVPGIRGPPGARRAATIV